MVRNGEWSLLRWQVRRAGPWMLLLPVFLAAFGVLLPDTWAAGPATGVAGFVLACALVLGLAAPRHPGATAHLILCGFSRPCIWRHLATAAVSGGVLCGAGAAGGLLGRGAGSELLGLAREHSEPVGPAAVFMVPAMAVLGAAAGLWLAARCVHAASSSARMRLAAAGVVVGAAGVPGVVLMLYPYAGVQAAVSCAALATAAGFLWRSRSIYVVIEPIRD